MPKFDLRFSILLAAGLLLSGAPYAAEPAAKATKVVYREAPAFPREAVAFGFAQGTVKARVNIEPDGSVSRVDIVDAQPRRIFDKAVIRALSLWKFEPAGVAQTYETEVSFKQDI